MRLGHYLSVLSPCDEPSYLSENSPVYEVDYQAKEILVYVEDLDEFSRHCSFDAVDADESMDESEIISRVEAMEDLTISTLKRQIRKHHEDWSLTHE